jgi:hypothetical protein
MLGGKTQRDVLSLHQLDVSVALGESVAGEE